MAEGEDNDPSTPSEDRLIDSKAFQLGGGIDLDAFISSEDISKAKRPALPGGSPTDATEGSNIHESEDEDNHDSAIGDMFEPFERNAALDRAIFFPMERSMKHLN